MKNASGAKSSPPSPLGRLVVTKNPGGFLLRRRGLGIGDKRGDWRLHRGSNPVPSKPPSGRNDRRTPMTLEPMVPAERSFRCRCPEGGSVKVSCWTSYIYPQFMQIPARRVWHFPVVIGFFNLMCTTPFQENLVHQACQVLVFQQREPKPNI